ncbi:hypothetical protein OC834_007098 [Tilletia horrida]|nr:hypothetical protein OC834_007098 [Tilletia horrida]
MQAIEYPVYTTVDLSTEQRAQLHEELADAVNCSDFSNVSFNIRPFRPEYASKSVHELVDAAIQAHFASVEDASADTSASPQGTFQQLYKDFFEHGLPRGECFCFFVVDERSARTLDADADESFNILACGIESYLPEEAIDMFYSYDSIPERELLDAHPKGSKERLDFIKQELPPRFDNHKKENVATDEQMTFRWTMDDPDALPDEERGDRFAVVFVARSEAGEGIETLMASEVKTPSDMFGYVSGFGGP